VPPVELGNCSDGVVVSIAPATFAAAVAGAAFTAAAAYDDDDDDDSHGNQN